MEEDVSFTCCRNASSGVKEEMNHIKFKIKLANSQMLAFLWIFEVLFQEELKDELVRG